MEDKQNTKLAKKAVLDKKAKNKIKRTKKQNNKKKKKKEKKSSTDTTSSSSSFDDRPILNSLKLYTNHKVEVIYLPVQLEACISQQNCTTEITENLSTSNLNNPKSSSSYSVCSPYTTINSTTSTSSSSSSSSNSSSSSSSTSRSSSSSSEPKKRRPVCKPCTTRTEHLSKREPIANFIKNHIRRRHR